MGSSKKIEGPQYKFSLKQGSLCNLTLDNFLINKPINIINNLNKNVIPSQECHVMQNPSSSSSSSSSPQIFHSNPKPMEKYPIQSGAGNQFEGFVWNNPAPLMAKIDHDLRGWEQQEMVLPLMPVQGIVGSNFQGSSEINGDFENKLIMDLGFSDYNKQLKTTTDCSDFGGESERKSRKHRRMIKKSESAARSRARKQKVLQLQTTNNWLRKRKEVNNVLNTRSISAPRHQLRQTNSTEF